MLRVESPKYKWWNAAFFIIALLVVVADQLSKLWIKSYSEGQIVFETGFFRIIHIHNTGASFGLFQDHSFALTIVAFIGIAFVLLYVFLVPRYFPFLSTRMSRVSLGMVLGGIIGNLIDRLNQGYVTDFIDTSIWPIFNIADSAITVGVILFALFFLLSSKTKTEIRNAK
jgi:signal peptidase II